MPERADWEKLAGPALDTPLQFELTVPNYWAAVMPFPNLQRGEGPAVDRSSGRSPLIRVRHIAFLHDADPSVNSAGIVAAFLSYNPAGIVAPYFLGTAPPAAPSPQQGWHTMAADVYDPIELPVGGVNYPIWTQPSADPLETIAYAYPADNPGYLYGVVFVQINGSVDIADAVSCRQQFFWEPVDTFEVGRSPYPIGSAR